VRDAVIARASRRFFLGSAYKNKGVQPLMDAVTRYLPSPLIVAYTAPTLRSWREVALGSDASNRSSAWRSRSWTTSSASSPFCVFTKHG